MNGMHTLNTVLWGTQIFLALFFLGAGAPKVMGRGIERWAGFSELPRPLVIVIGVTEVLAAIGLVLPMGVGIAPWLTPVAAAGVAVIVLMATGFHLRADERLEAVETTLWASVAAVVAAGRWDLVTAASDVPAGVLITALAVLIPAAIINVAVLTRRPVKRSGEWTRSRHPDRDLNNGSV